MPELTKPVIDSFKGQYRFLSNFSGSLIEFEGLVYPTVEHAYQAAKSNSRSIRETIRSLPTAGRAKAAGRVVKLRNDWEEVKLIVMYFLLWQKFQIQAFSDALETTGEAELVEGNNWGDTFWGVCSGVGENHLGKLLMTIRYQRRTLNKMFGDWPMLRRTNSAKT